MAVTKSIKRKYNKFYSKDKSPVLAETPEAFTEIHTMLFSEDATNYSFESRVKAADEMLASLRHYRKLRKDYKTAFEDFMEIMKKRDAAEQKRTEVFESFAAMRSAAYQTPLEADAKMAELVERNGNNIEGFILAVKEISDNPEILGALKGNKNWDVNLKGFKVSRKADDEYKDSFQRIQDFNQEIPVLEAAESKLMAYDNEARQKYSEYSIDFNREDWADIYEWSKQAIDTVKIADVEKLRKDLVEDGISAWVNMRKTNPIKAWGVAILRATDENASKALKDAWEQEVREISKTIMRDPALAQFAEDNGLLSAMHQATYEELPLVQPRSQKQEEPTKSLDDMAQMSEKDLQDFMQNMTPEQQQEYLQKMIKQQQQEQQPKKDSDNNTPSI